MKLECPEFKRCCFCIPLRYGLLVWGYIKLVTTLVVFLFVSFAMQMYIQLLFFYGNGILPMILLGTALLVFLMVDIGMTLTFLIGGHQKTAKLLRVFYFYSITLTGIDAALLFISIIYDLSVADDYEAHYRSSGQVLSYGATVVTKTVTGVLLIGLQAYIVLLLRSEINKLKNNRNFKFINHTAEAGCSMENQTNDSGLMDAFRTIEIEDREIGKDDRIGGMQKTEDSHMNDRF